MEPSQGRVRPGAQPFTITETQTSIDSIDFYDLLVIKIIVEVLSKKLSKDELLQTLATVSRELHLGSKNFSKELLAWLDGLEFGLKF